MRQIKKIIVHCSDSAYGCFAIINQWHKDRGWEGAKSGISCGYHYLLLNGYPRSSRNCYSFLDGSIECGRPLEEVGAHVYGYNKDSIGMCLVGKSGEFTHRQYRVAKAMILSLLHKFDLFINDIVGHCELDDKKLSDPGFKMDTFRNYVNDIVALEKLLTVSQ